MIENIDDIIKMLVGSPRVTVNEKPHIYFEIDLKTETGTVTIPVQSFETDYGVFATMGSSGKEYASFLNELEKSDDGFQKPILQSFVEDCAKIIFLTSGNLTDSDVEDIRHFLFFFGDSSNGLKAGRFTTSIMEAISCADPSNRSKLKQVYPNLVKTFEVIQLPNGVESLVKALNERSSKR